MLTDNKDSQLVRGQSAVVSLLGKLPSTQHSPESFVVDVAISLVIHAAARFFLLLVILLLIYLNVIILLLLLLFSVSVDPESPEIYLSVF